MTNAPGRPSPSRIAGAFARARSQGRKALVLYLTGCDPDFETSRRLLLAAARAGADVLELGVPWSDPSADGPAIQAAMRRALAAGGGMAKALDLCRAVRADNPEIPVVLFGYANPIFVRGAAKFAAQAKQAGADGVLCVDWPADEDPELAQALAQQGLDLVPLIAPTSTPERVKAIAAVAGGFLYYVSLTGITGSQLPNLDEASARVRAGARTVRRPPASRRGIRDCHASGRAGGGRICRRRGGGQRRSPRHRASRERGSRSSARAGSLCQRPARGARLTRPGRNRRVRPRKCTKQGTPCARCCLWLSDIAIILQFSAFGLSLAPRVWDRRRVLDPVGPCACAAGSAGWRCGCRSLL